MSTLALSSRAVGSTCQGLRRRPVGVVDTLRRLTAAQPSTRPCGDLRTRTTMPHLTRLPIVAAIVGAAGSGKTTLCHRLAEELGVGHLGPDSFSGAGADRWHALLRALETSTHPVIVESVAVPAAYRRILIDTGTPVIGVDCALHVRLRRVAARGWAPWRVRKTSIYCWPLRPDCVVDGSDDLNVAVTAALAAIEGTRSRDD